jgi:hypothetical protein
VLRGLEALLNTGAAVAMAPPLPEGWAAAPKSPVTAAGVGPCPKEDQPAAVSEPEKRRGRPKKTDTPAAAPTPAPEPEPAPADDVEDIQPEPPEEPAPITDEDLRKKLNKLGGVIGVPKALAVLEQSGHKKVAEVPPEKRPNLMLLLDNAIAKGEAERAKAAA